MFYVVVLLLYVFFFFFKQKTAYEMRISDWSSDVCSSDLDSRRGFAIGAESAIGQIEGSATMPFYEHVFIARQDLSQAQVDALAETVTNVIGEYKGTVHKTETWGLKQLAYKIAKNRQGPYAMLSVERSEEHTSELQSLIRIQ